MKNSATLRPRLVVAGAASAIDYYTAVFGAREVARHTDPNGKIVHAELAIGDSGVTLKDEDGADRAPTSPGGSAALLTLDLDDVDAVAGRMVAAGGAVVFPVEDCGYGRS